jgi:hypothetical protein
MVSHVFFGLFDLVYRKKKRRLVRYTHPIGKGGGETLRESESEIKGIPNIGQRVY